MILGDYTGKTGAVPRVRPGLGPLARSLATAGLLALAGCAAPGPMPATDPDATPDSPATPPVAGAPPPAPAEPPPAPEPVYRAFPRETLFELLTAELALREGALEPALASYARQARRTRDPGVVARAAQLSGYGGDPQRAAELAVLWTALAPEDPEARQTAAVALIRAGRLDDALEQLGALRALGGEARFTYLAAHAEGIDLEGREALLAGLRSLREAHPDDPQLVLAVALLLEQQGREEEALAVLAALPEAAADEEAVLLEARLLEGLGRPEEALAVLRAGLDRGVGDGRLRYTLARLLVSEGRLDEAREAFETLLLSAGESPELLLSLALVNLETDRLEEAQGYLERLLATGRREDAAHYYLGELAERRGDADAAVAAFAEVGPGYEFARAQARAATLLLERVDVQAAREYLAGQRREHPDEAVTLRLVEGDVLMAAERPELALEALDAALAEAPDDIDLLYARAMTAEAAGLPEGLERDLRRILALDADNAMALNALGYTLADRGERLEEARTLVLRALEQAPEEPAYVDSLGWVEYRLGNLEEAVALLRRAFAAFPNHEVAAHLGEALWAVGDEDAARRTWRRGLELDPDSSVLERTIRRFLGDEGLARLRPGEDA